MNVNNNASTALNHLRSSLTQGSAGQAEAGREGSAVDQADEAGEPAEIGEPDHPDLGSQADSTRAKAGVEPKAKSQLDRAAEEALSVADIFVGGAIRAVAVATVVPIVVLACYALWNRSKDAGNAGESDPAKPGTGGSSDADGHMASSTAQDTDAPELAEVSDYTFTEGELASATGAGLYVPRDELDRATQEEGEPQSGPPVNEEVDGETRQEIEGLPDDRLENALADPPRIPVPDKSKQLEVQGEIDHAKRMRGDG